VNYREAYEQAQRALREYRADPLGYALRNKRPPEPIVVSPAMYRDSLPWHRRLAWDASIRWRRLRSSLWLRWHYRTWSWDEAMRDALQEGGSLFGLDSEHATFRLGVDPNMPPTEAKVIDHEGDVFRIVNIGPSDDGARDG
jgi:hypothetical protein